MVHGSGKLRPNTPDSRRRTPPGAACSLSSVGWRCLVSSLGGVALFPSPLARCCFLPFFGWLLLPCLLLGGAAWFPPFGGVAVFLFLFGGVAFFRRGCFFPSVGWCCLVSSLGGVAFPLSLCVVLPSFTSFRWSCFTPSWWAVLLGCLLLLWVVFAVCLLLLVVLPSFSSFGWCCSLPLSFGAVAAFFPSFGWLLFTCLLLCGGAAWSPPPLGGVAFIGLGVWQMRRATRGVAGWVVAGWSGLGERLLPVLRVSLAESHADNADENTSGRRPIGWARLTHRMGRSQCCREKRPQWANDSRSVCNRREHCVEDVLGYLRHAKRRQ